MTSTPYTTRPQYSSKILIRGNPEYERCRRNNPSAATPDRYPQEIHIPESPEDVAAALLKAAELGVHVGIRSSGHIFGLGALIQDGIMIDTTSLNRQVDYDVATQEVSFGPAVRVEEVADKLAEIKRFFPHGHSPTVAAGGFLLAGGQGWFVRGWGATAQSWITKMEIVVPDGRVLTASRTENQDLFWAARGSGLGFFGVVTRFWSRTIPASTLWERNFTFEVGTKYETLLTWALTKGDETPKYGTDINITIYYPEKYDPTCFGDDIPEPATLHMSLSLLCYADTNPQAKILLSAFDDMPSDVKDSLLDMRPVTKTSFQRIFRTKRGFIGLNGDKRWTILSMLSEPSTPLPQLLSAVKPALLELPTRTSVVFICTCDIVPDEVDSAITIPQQYYISTITQWSDPKLEPYIYQPMRDRYRRALPAAAGVYVADYDVTCDDANGKVMSDTALAKFLKIREKWDPKGIFPNYKKFIETHNKVNRGLNKAKI
ncbi:related to 6-hydroxy-D-nicotine oxidase [Cephalotrichum gorgonifer]|uniref:Related to 6-hydroxy-D-nicotine oxidase n=1 Tax=Cephalotrichum gorgonifer TaxID=2041049 RepID=A0AAE8SY15_9PEZI|nr:related to 6-hydroxy-D-nicotine oxidase [Cephalotrichum gorgonifer]